MLKECYPIWLAGEPQQTHATLTVYNKYTRQPATQVCLAGPAEIEEAIRAAVRAFEKTRRMPSHQRRDVLHKLLDGCRQRADELARVLAIEVGKTITEARGEVARMLETIQLAAEEATRIGGGIMPVDLSPRTEGYRCFWRRYPIGPCSFITPFNFPLNLMAHKIGPAIAAGCTWVLKPAPDTPVSSLILAEILADCGLPRGAFSVIPCDVKDAAPLVEDERIRLLSFTGSPQVGWQLRSRAGTKKVLLELGGNAACIVDDSADLDFAAERITIGAFSHAGQSCISVQRIFIHEAVYEALRDRLIERAQAIRPGDPLDENTTLGPLIREADAARVELWVHEAVEAGARVLCGGRRDGVFYAPTYLENVDPQQRISCQEVFGPVAILSRFDDFEQALPQANDSRFGLQAGVFTRDIARVLRAWDTLEVGGVVINDVPTMRTDAMPYGGVKASGLGREGVRFAIEEMTEPCVLLVRDR